jgi:hypothetical protein
VNTRTAAELLTGTRFVAIETLGGRIIQIRLEPLSRIPPDFMQKCPGKDPGRVHVIEPEAYRLVADGID